MSLQLVCINYGIFKDAVTVVKHCLKVFPRFDKVTILHPNPDRETWDLTEDLPRIEVFTANSPTQNECCLYEMPSHITCHHAIGIQWDGFIVNPESWTDEFLEYDYIAPPWPLTNIINPEHRVGSGGFMLFSQRMAQIWGELCQPHPFPCDWDMGAVNRAKFEAVGMKFAPLELAMRWGEEIPLDDQVRVEKPFGMHGFGYSDHLKYKTMMYGI